MKLSKDAGLDKYQPLFISLKHKKTMASSGHGLSFFTENIVYQLFFTKKPSAVDEQDETPIKCLLIKV